MAYTALARRYRSQSFDQVVGQEPIAQTLRNAIATNRLHHAYLFTGTRGVGKTTMARLFARALNAPDSLPDIPHLDSLTYPDTDVQQRMADAIMRGDDLNVIEIDAASNTGVDNVRQLIANATLVPTDNAAFKIYIIDEVHMLSNAAFNALLKIMEEPPSHVKFILATTESHKVPATIHSRCQRFDFRNIPTAKIVEHITDVLKQEKIGADEAVIHQIASAGNGSMRDALSLLDRILAAGEDPLTPDLLQRMLGFPDRTLISQLTDALAAANPADALTLTDQLLSRGIGHDQLLTSLTEHLRNVMLLSAAGPKTTLVDLDEQTRAAAAKQAQHFDTTTIVHAIALLENVAQRSRFSSSPRALLDAAIVRLALSENFAQAAALLSADPSAQKKNIAPPNRPAPQIITRPNPNLSPTITTNQPVSRDAKRSVVESPAPTQTQSRPVSNPEAGPERSEGPGTHPQSSPSSRPTPRPTPHPTSRTTNTRPNTLSEKQRDALLNQPLVKQVADLFDARLTSVQPLPDQPPAPPTDSDEQDKPNP